MTPMNQFAMQVSSLNPLTIRSLARWQRELLARRNPLLSGMVASMTDEEMAARYFQSGHEERQRLADRAHELRQRSLLKLAARSLRVSSDRLRVEQPKAAWWMV